MSLNQYMGEVLVRTDYKESGTVSIEFDTYCHPYDYSYRRPQFTIKSADAEEMNQEIKADFKAVVEDYGGNGIYYGVYNTVSYENSQPYDEIANDNSGIFKRVIDYDSAVFNDILSVRVTDTNCVTWKNTDWEVSTVYTLDLTDGSRLTGKDVLNRIGMGQQDLLDRLYWEIERESKDLIFSIELFDPESDEIPDWLQSDIDGEINASLTLNDFDEILENGIYLNQNGHLEVRLMMQLGAASEYTIIVDIDPTPTDFPTDSPSDYNVGCWIGGFGSVIVLREDHSALYCEPENQNRPELQAGIECTWDYVNGYPSLTGENLDYDLYMERHHDSDGMLVYANDGRWTPEIFQLCPGLSEEEAKKGLQYNPCEIMFAIGDWSSIETFAQDNGLELMAGGERDYFSLFSSDGPEKASVLTIGQYTLDDAIYASCDGPCEITLCGVKVEDSIEKAEDNVPRYGSVYATEGYTDYNGDDVAIIHLGARNGFHYSVQYTISENTIISWYVYTVDSDYDIGVDRITETFITTGVHQFIISHPGYWTDHVRFEETPEGNWRIFNIENETAETDGLLGEIVFSDFQSRQRLVDYCAELNERYGDAFRMLDRNEIPVVYASEWSGGIIYVSMAWGSGHYTAENKDLYMKLYSVFYEARNTITVQ